MESIRLNKYISDSGVCSRREADRLIRKGMVRINNELGNLGSLVRKNDKVLVNGLLIEPKKEDQSIYVMLNKPVGITSTTDTSDRTNIVDYVAYHERIFPIGRLDKDSQGLILMTNDGDIVNKILRAGNNHEKEYLVTVDKAYGENFLKQMANGVPILGLVTKKCKVEYVNATKFKITLIQGVNRQIRRMCEYFGLEVIQLERTRIMHLKLDGLALGDFRELKYEEVSLLFDQLKESRKDSEKSVRNDELSKEKIKREKLKKEEAKLVVTKTGKKQIESSEAAQLEYAALMKTARQKEGAWKRKINTKFEAQSVEEANKQRSAKGKGKKPGLASGLKDTKPTKPKTVSKSGNKPTVKRTPKGKK